MSISFSDFFKTKRSDMNKTELLENEMEVKKKKRWLPFL